MKIYQTNIHAKSSYGNFKYLNNLPTQNYQKTNISFEGKEDNVGTKGLIEKLVNKKIVRSSAKKRISNITESYINMGQNNYDSAMKSPLKFEQSKSFDKSIDFYLKAEKLAKKIKNNELLAQTTEGLGNLARDYFKNESLARQLFYGAFVTRLTR